MTGRLQKARRSVLSSPTGLAVIAILAGAMPAAAQTTVADFYKGRQVTIIVGSSPGGGYDTYARLIARHMGKHVLGSPAFLLQNLPGAGGNVLANQLAAIGPRDGTVIGEGGGAFVLERYEHAVQRGAPIYAEILGVGAGCDGSSAANRSEGVGLVRAIQSAMRQASIEPRDLGHINAHGKATQRDDWAESRAYHNALGMSIEKIPVTALKSYFGHFDAGAGAVELAGSLLAMRHGVLPITLNYRNPDPLCQLNVIHDEPVRLSTPFAMSVNRTRMGQSAAAIIRAI